MSVFELLAIAFGLSMDAFAVAVSKGLCMRKMQYRYALFIGLFFGGFQAVMTFTGYILGVQFKNFLTPIDHWLIFALLCMIGINMILESQKKGKVLYEKISLKNIMALSLATSIDALAVGITFSFLQANILRSIVVIGLVTFVLSFFGVVIGNIFGVRFKSKAEIAGGIILILIGTKILFEHLGILNI